MQYYGIYHYAIIIFTLNTEGRLRHIFHCIVSYFSHICPPHAAAPAAIIIYYAINITAIIGHFNIIITGRHFSSLLFTRYIFTHLSPLSFHYVIILHYYYHYHCYIIITESRHTCRCIFIITPPLFLPLRVIIILTRFFIEQ